MVMPEQYEAVLEDARSQWMWWWLTKPSVVELMAMFVFKPRVW